MHTNLNGKTVLLGEDEPEVRGYLEMALRCNGFSVATAENGD
jgi:DNA-binding response OmpR family regulator